MNRFLAILVRNAPLYLAAVVVASILYAGLVFSQNVRVWPGPVPIESFGQAKDVFLLDVAPQAVTSIRFVAPGDVAAGVSGVSFRATVDLSGLTPPADGSPLTVSVKVEALDPRIQVTSWSPTFASIRLDPIHTNTVPVHVDRGTVPEGLTLGEPQVDVSSATVRGPASVVDRVVAAVARVHVDPSGVDVDQDVDLIAVDARGDRLTPVDLTPRSVHVTIQVSVAGTTRTVPVVAALSGVPATGFAVTGVRVQPDTLVISGPLPTLQAVDHLDTTTVSVAGARNSVDTNATLVLPAGVSVVDGTTNVRVIATIGPLSGSTTYTVAVVLTGTSPDLTYALSTGSTLVTVSGTMAALDALDGASLRAVADVSGLGVGAHTVTLRVQVPNGLTVSSLSPSQVTVSIGSTPTPTPAPTPT